MTKIRRTVLETHSHFSICLKILFRFLDSQVLLCKTTSLPSDRGSVHFRHANQDLWEESLTNAWVSCSIHLCEAMNVTASSWDWIVDVIFRASPERRKENKTHKCSRFQPFWWLAFALCPQPGPFPPLQAPMESYPELNRAHGHIESTPRRLSGSRIALGQIIFSVCTPWVHFNAPKITAAHFSQPKPYSQIWRALHPVQCFPLISWNWKTMLKHCELSYMIFERFLLQTLREWV